MNKASLARSIPLCFALACSARAYGQSLSPEAVVRAFHEALQNGNIASIKQSLAADASIMEGGHVESRDEYLSHHLAADIEFAKAVPTQFLSLQSSINGATAWVKSTSSSKGTFRGQPVNSMGAELVVLTQTSSSWEIRAIHWSSFKPK